MNGYQLEIFVNTDVQRFEQWVERFRLRNFPRRYAIEQGKDLSVIGAPTLKGTYQGTRTHEVNASIATPHPDKADTEVHTLGFPVLRLSINELAVNRLQVECNCSHTVLLPTFIEMLGEILHLWPETKDPILGFFSQFIDIDDRERSQSMPESRKQNKGRGMTDQTRRKIIKLAEYRQIQIDKGREPVGWTKACKQFGNNISPKTAKKYAPELNANWGDLDYVWEGFEEKPG